MPKVGMEPIRRQQLIDASLDVIGEVGFQGLTIALISRKAGLSTGIISHYFGGKKGLIEATVRYLVSQLWLEKPPTDPKARLMAIIDANFAPVQQSEAASRTWLSFWSQSVHEPELMRLQTLNKRRLVSNLSFSYKQLLPKDKVKEAAEVTTAMIDGLWLHSALDFRSPDTFDIAKQRCKDFVELVLANYK